ncbi:MAG: hypothetical protein GY811_24585 [Myxococcales bacterium]|nr:hypothetical protein [Myxococcales bacterium]
MEHIAIDLGGRESQICVRDHKGVILEERRCRTRVLGNYLRRRPHCRVILETCAEGFGVADLASIVPGPNEPWDWPRLAPEFADELAEWLETNLVSRLATSG